MPQAQASSDASEELLTYMAQTQRKATSQSVNYKFSRVVACVPQNIILSLKSFLNLLIRLLIDILVSQTNCCVLKLRKSQSIKQGARSSTICICDECYHNFCIVSNCVYKVSFPVLGEKKIKINEQ